MECVVEVGACGALLGANGFAVGTRTLSCVCSAARVVGPMVVTVSPADGVDATQFGAAVAGGFGVCVKVYAPPPANTTTDVFVVFQDGATRRLDAFHWGLVPRWAKDLSVGNRMINARAETVASKPAFRSAFAKRRCIVPVDGFYEWKDTGDGKQPYWISSADGKPLSIAGIRVGCGLSVQ